MAVTNGAQVGPAFTGGQVGDVGEPGDIAAALVELAFDQVGCQKVNYPIVRMCRLLEVDRRRFYDWRRRKQASPTVREQRMVELAEKMLSRTEASGVKASLDPAPGVKLGKPVLSGSKATYTDVAPGLDVVVDVAAGGFRWSWVAKTPAAAKKLLVGSGKSRAATARLKVSGGGKWAKDGAEAKISNGQGAKVARLGSPLVWDAQVNPTRISRFVADR